MRKQILLLAILIFTLFGCTQADHINSLIQLLADKNTSVSQAASDELVTVGAPAVKPLVVLLNNKDSTIRTIASDTLARIGLPAIDPLIVTLRDNNNDACQAASEALIKIGSPVIDPLIIIMWDPDDNIRYRVVEVLGRIQDQRVIQPLIFHLKDQSASVRHLAAKRLLSMSPLAMETLINVIDDVDSDLRLEIGVTLGDLGDLRGVPILIDSLADDNETICQGASTALIKIGSPAVELLLQGTGGTTTDGLCRRYYVLGEIKDVLAIEPLIGGLSDGNAKVSQAAAKALIAIGPPAVDPLLNFMRDWTVNNKIRNSCWCNSLFYFILGEIKDARSVKPLMDELVRVESCPWGYSCDTDVLNALEKIGAPAAEPLFKYYENFWNMGALSTSFNQHEPIAVIILSIIDKTSGIERKHIEDLLVNLIKEDANYTQKDLFLIESFYPFYISMAVPNSESALIEAFNSSLFANEQMAEDFLNCGNARLARAVKEWAPLHHYEVTTVTQFTYERQSPIWGESK